MKRIISYFNSKDLSNLLQSFEHQGKGNLAESINLKGKYLFGQAGETPDIEYLMAPIEEYEPLDEK